MNPACRGYAKVHFSRSDADAKSTVLRLSFLRHVDLREGLERCDHTQPVRPDKGHPLLQCAVDTETNAASVRLRLNMNITGAYAHGIFQHLARRLDAGH